MVEEIEDQIRDEIYTLKGRILSYVKENKNSEKPITSCDIQREFNIKKSTASEYLCALENSKLIKRKSDGKFKSIKITELGDSFV